MVGTVDIGEQHAVHIDVGKLAGAFLRVVFYGSVNEAHVGAVGTLSEVDGLLCVVVHAAIVDIVRPLGGPVLTIVVGDVHTEVVGLIASAVLTGEDVDIGEFQLSALREVESGRY